MTIPEHEGEISIPLMTSYSTSYTLCSEGNRKDPEKPCGILMVMSRRSCLVKREVLAKIRLISCTVLKLFS